MSNTQGGSNAYQAVLDLSSTLHKVTQDLAAQAQYCEAQGMYAEALIFAKYARRLQINAVQGTNGGYNHVPHSSASLNHV